MTFMRVLLPAPFSPMSACTSPWRNSRSTPSSATVGPNAFLICDSLRATGDTILLRISLEGVVERLSGLHARAFIGPGDCHDAHVIVGWQRQRGCACRHVDRVGKQV